MMTQVLNSMETLMFGRPLDHHIREWDPRYGPRLATMGDTFLKYAGNVLVLTMMGVNELWMCLGEGRQRYIRQPETSLLQILFPAGEDVNMQTGMALLRNLLSRSLA